MLNTREIYSKICQQSADIHSMTEKERLQLQSHLRKMYQDIEAICDRHNLSMCTGYGTVLGALRHKGFIPWDDDIDILLPRKDYDRLINDYAAELPSQYKVFSPNSKNGPIYRFAKIVDTTTRLIDPYADTDDESHGIFIDVFPLENTPTDIRYVKLRRAIACLLMVIASAVFEYKHHNEFYKKLMCSTLSGKRVYYIRQLIGFLFSYRDDKSWFNLFDRFAQYKKSTGYYSVPSGESGKWKYFQPYPVDLYFPAVKMPFDNIEVYVPQQAERHCEIEYGDWHWIPPVEERWQHYIKELRFDQS